VWTIVAFVVALLLVLLVVAIFSAAPDVITKLAIGVLIALALDPLINILQSRFKLSRGVSAAVVSGVLIVVFSGIAVLLGPPAVREAQEVATQLPETVEDFYSWPIIGPRLESADAAGTVSDWLDELPSRFDEETVASLAESLLGGVETLFIVMISAIAVMMDGEALVARARRLVPPSRRPRAIRAGRIAYDSVGRYFAGSLFVAVLNGTFILTVGLALGVPLAPLAAIWAMVTNLIPQIGGFLGGSFFVLLALSESPLTGAIALALFLVYQQVENNVIQPAIIGKAVNLTPPTTMLAALIGGAAAGVPGALAATPLIGAVKALWFAFRRPSDSESAGT
jgi:predicted PurR-regulated permease PerM